MERICSQKAKNWKEGRRLRAWELFQQGWEQCRIAQALGVTKGAISQWVKRARNHGTAALLHRKPTGAPCKLTAEQLAQLPQLLERGPQAWGFLGEVWTQPRIAEVVRREFGVSYHPSQFGRILKGFRWSRQKPMRRARQRDEGAIKRWKEERWPLLKKKPSKKSAPSSL